MRILDERVEGYLHDLRPARSEVMAEMEAVARRDSVPIVHWETGRFLATLCRAFDPSVLEVGTAIGYSTVHLAEPLSAGKVTTLEIDPRETIPTCPGRSTCSSSTPPKASTASTSTWPSRCSRSARCS